MLRTLIISLFGIFIIPVNFSAQTWVQLSDFPAPERDDGVAFVINGKAYCGSGLKVGWSLGNDFYCLDLSSETWTTIASMPAGQERQYACGFTNGVNGYVFGGEAGGTDLNTLWMYSPATNSWTAKASKPGNGVRGASCFVINTTAYIIGGAYSSTDALNEVWAYDMVNDSWSQKNNLPITNWRGSAASTNGKGYLLFGMNVNYGYNRFLYEYDPGSDQWSYKSAFGGGGTGKVYANMQSIYNELIVFSGKDSLNNFSNELWSYDITANSWTQKTTLGATLRKGGMGFTNNGIYYYTCGISPADVRLKETWKIGLSVGIKEYSDKENPIIYPNPVKDILYIRNYRGQNFRIYNALGQVSSEGKIENGAIDVSKLDRGIYFLHLNGLSSKIIIE